MPNLHLTFVLCSASQKEGEDFSKFCGFLRIYELYCYCAQATFFITFVAMENAQTVFIVLNTRHRNERNIIKDLLRCKR